MDRPTPKRIERMADILTGLAAALVDQAAFFTDPTVQFGIENLAEGAVMATKRVASAQYAEANHLLAMEKTLFVELTRALLTIETVLRNAGSEAWPDLPPLLSEGQALLRSAASDNPALFWPAGVDPDALLQHGTSAPFATPSNWISLSGGYFDLQEDGILLSALPVQGRKGRSWLGRVGGTGVGLCAEPDLAAAAASEAYARLFGVRPASVMAASQDGQEPKA